MKTKNSGIQICIISLLFLNYPFKNILAQDLSQDTAYVVTEIWDGSEFWDSEPIFKLPEHIPIYEDLIYLYADFDTIINDTLQIYIINNTSDKFKYNGYLLTLLQQEFKDTNNIWVRTRSHFYGWCGNGYLWEDGIRSREFIVYKDVIPEVGEEQEVRYHFYNTDIITSNIGLVKINKKEVEEAKFDDIALKIRGADFLIKIIKGEIAPFATETENETLIQRAIPNLSFYYPDEAIPILESIATDPSNKFQRQAIANLKSIEKKKQK
jgi:hypothetical protein